MRHRFRAGAAPDPPMQQVCADVRDAALCRTGVPSSQRGPQPDLPDHGRLLPEPLHLLRHVQGEALPDPAGGGDPGGDRRDSRATTASRSTASFWPTAMPWSIRLTGWSRSWRPWQRPFRGLTRVGSYASPNSLTTKSPAAAGHCCGRRSCASSISAWSPGMMRPWQRSTRGSPPTKMAELALTAREAGMKLSVTAILGPGRQGAQPGACPGNGGLGQPGQSGILLAADPVPPP